MKLARDHLERRTAPALNTGLCIVGKRTVDCAIKIGLIDPECVLKIKGIPHAQMVRM